MTEFLWNRKLNIQIRKGRTQVWTRDPTICSRMLYHWAILLNMNCAFSKLQFLWAPHSHVVIGTWLNVINGLVKWQKHRRAGSGTFKSRVAVQSRMKSVLSRKERLMRIPCNPFKSWLTGHVSSMLSRNFNDLWQVWMKWIKIES